MRASFSGSRRLSASPFHPAMILDRPFVAALNHLLVDETWARALLQPFAGAVVHVVLPPVASHALLIEPSGLVARARDTAVPHATIRLPPRAVAGIAMDRERGLDAATFEGDPALADALRQLVAQLRWDAEDDLARVVGDIPARRIVGAGRAVAEWRRDAASRLAENAREYLAEESRLVVGADESRRFATEVDALRAALERLEARVDAVAERASGADDATPST
jgi:ubiquinone biosynthesis protein UbiJ